MQINPIIEKDLKTKMRGWKAPTLITFYLGFLGFLIWVFFIDNIYSAYNYFDPRLMTDVFKTIASFQFGLIVLITPVLTATAISGEKERQTLDLLLCTDYSTFKIVIGKIVVSIAHVLLLITASLPILSTVFLFGGIGIIDMLRLFAFYLVTALLIASLGMLFSTIFRRSPVSIIVTYIMVLGLLYGTLILHGLYLILYQNFTGQMPQAPLYWVLYTSPVFGFASVIGTDGGGIISVFLTGTAYGRVAAFGQISPWIINTAFSIVVSILIIIFCAWKIKPVK